MKFEKNDVTEAAQACRTRKASGLDLPANNALPSEGVDLTHPEMERRLRAQRVWEFLDESKSTFYARMDEDEPSYDPLFPLPIPSSSTGRGPKRWKLGAVIAWMRSCEAAATAPGQGSGHEG